MTIDYVVPYVNSRDSVWISEYRKYVSGTCDWSNNASRFRDWGILKYQLRSLCKHTPWIHRIFIVVSISESQVPDWLNTDNPRIRVVLDSEFLPKENLPIFNSNVIDLYIPRIKDLAEHYLYACDDYLVLKDLCMSDFFDGDSIKLKLEMRTLHKCTYTRTIANSNRFFDNNLVTESQTEYHMPFCDHAIVPHLKSENLKLLRDNEEVIQNSLSRFREAKNITWQIYPMNMKERGKLRQGTVNMKYSGLHQVSDIKKIGQRNADAIVLNDEFHGNYFSARLLLEEKLSTMFPDKCEFER